MMHIDSEQRVGSPTPGPAAAAAIKHGGSNYRSAGRCRNYTVTVQVLETQDKFSVKAVPGFEYQQSGGRGSRRVHPAVTVEHPAGGV